MGLSSLMSEEHGFDFRNMCTLPSLAVGVFRGLWPRDLASLLTQIKIMTLAVKLFLWKKGALG